MSSLYIISAKSFDTLLLYLYFIVTEIFLYMSIPTYFFLYYSTTYSFLCFTLLQTKISLLILMYVLILEILYILYTEISVSSICSFVRNVSYGRNSYASCYCIPFFPLTFCYLHYILYKNDKKMHEKHGELWKRKRKCR